MCCAHTAVLQGGEENLKSKRSQVSCSNSCNSIVASMANAILVRRTDVWECPNRRKIWVKSSPRPSESTQIRFCSTQSMANRRQTLLKLICRCSWGCIPEHKFDGESPKSTKNPHKISNTFSHTNLHQFSLILY